MTPPISLQLCYTEYFSAYNSFRNNDCSRNKHSFKAITYIRYIYSLETYGIRYATLFSQFSSSVHRPSSAHNVALFLTNGYLLVCFGTAIHAQSELDGLAVPLRGRCIPSKFQTTRLPQAILLLLLLLLPRPLRFAVTMIAPVDG